MSDYLYSKYEYIMRFPPFKLLGNLIANTYYDIIEAVNRYNLRNHPRMRRLVQKLLGRIDAVASTSVRFFEIVVYNSRKLMQYQVMHKPGHFEYKQVTTDDFSSEFNVIARIQDLMFCLSNIQNLN